MSRTPKIAITKQYVGVNTDGETVKTNSIQPGVKYSGVAFNAIGKDELVAEIGAFDQVALAARGLMSFISAAVGGVESIDKFFDLASDRINLLKSGEYSDRGGERGANLDRFVAVILGTTELKAKLLSKVGSDDSADVKEWVEARIAKLDAEKPAGKDAKGKDTLSGGAEFLATIRKFPEYQETQLRLFPREPREGKKVSVDDLFGD
jgi:hypothetical protein